ncbi:hypothetical protein [Natrinema sp. 74]|uniref:hypothetical protein n=1 Tax=Natrinema sp. 74 TaxID=3384159 RepID=UPI0038D3CEDB
MARPLHESNDLLVPADVLGTFGVTPADIGRESDDDTLKTALGDALATGVDRTTVLRRTITRSDRGLACSARYSAADLESELTAVFEAIGWSLAVTHTQDGLELAATDSRGRRRDPSVSYPETPLGSDNLPAVLWAVNDGVLAETDAQFVLLSSGIDRWRAALVKAGELERLRDRYGPRIEAAERPLLPEHGLEAYVPAADNGTTGRTDCGASGGTEPWPPWALEPDPARPASSSAAVASLIDEAEPAMQARPDAESAAGEGSRDATVASSPTADTGASSTSAPSSKVDGYELRGALDVSRTRAGDAESTGSETIERGARSSADASTDEFGTLSGTSSTARVANDAFGTDLESRPEGDRYRAVGAALDAGGTVSVRGLLEDDDFLPELPAAEPDEVRIEFADRCDPVSGPDAAIAAEGSEFEWVDTGSLKPTRVSNG